MYRDGNWGTVSDQTWDSNDANVVCRYLGYSHAESLRFTAHYGEGSGVSYRMQCEGEETSVQHCSYSPSGDSHSHDAGVECFDGEQKCTKNVSW